MLDVFLCHAEADHGVAATIAMRLEKCAESRIWLERIGDGLNVLDAWEGGLSSGAILLLLSPEAVPVRSDRESWRSILEHKGMPPVCGILVRDCKYPALLKRNPFFEWLDDTASLRAIEKWIISLHEPAKAHSFEPARNPFFTGREQELDQLMDLLVDSGGRLEWVHGCPSSGKSALAQEFARRAADHFREILWLDCAGRSSSSIAGELAARLSVRSGASTSEVLRKHRLLVVLDDLTGDLPFDIPSELQASILITTRDSAHGIQLPEIDRSPATVESADEPLLRALSACRPQGASLFLAAQMIGCEMSQAQRSAARLVSNRLLDPLDGDRFRVNQIADIHHSREHTLALLEVFSQSHAKRADFVAEVLPSIIRTESTDWTLARNLGRKAADFLRQEFRHAECVDLLRALRSAATRNNDKREIEECDWELSWLEDSAERPRSPMIGAEQTQLNLGF